MNSPAHICHLSVLNPALHSRIFYRLARSQARAGYRVSIIAQGDSDTSYSVEGVDIHPIPPFSRLDPVRMRVPGLLFSKAIKLKADLYVIHSPELLGIAAKLRKRLACKIVYDVHEDYAKNIRFGKGYPILLRHALARWTCRRELKAVSWLDGVSYAEEIYDNMLRVPEARKVILQNKFAPPGDELMSSKIELPPKPYLLYTGTVAEDWGIFETLQLWKQLNTTKRISLVVAGQAARRKTVELIEDFVAESGLGDRFLFLGKAKHLPYATIVELIQHCLAGTALYTLRPHIRGKIPTRFFEYSALGKALIYTDCPEWRAWDEAHGLGLSTESDPRELIELLEQWTGKADRSYSLWESEEEKLLDFTARVLG